MPTFGFSVRSIVRISALLGVCVLAAVQISSAVQCPTGGPQTTYRFVGQCTDCSGTGVGLLTVRNYTLGSSFDSCSFVSFTYTSNLVSFTITQSDIRQLDGALPASLPGVASIQVQGPGDENFESGTDGTWAVGATDYGTNGTWGPVPATVPVPTLSPAALGVLCLLLAGAGALVLARARHTARA
jgi:hypothetical protein